jgi:DtxR family Mn-dependent transcriptional regulator
MPTLTPAVEDYLKAVYKLETAPPEDSAPVSTSALAETLDLSAASVTNMAKRLHARSLVHHQSYQGVRLTEAGRKVALEIIRHHRLLELYLKEVMDYSWEQLHEEAERLEHHISEAFEDRLDELLGHPTHDPHGHPIPARDGTVTKTRAAPLTDAEADHRVVVHYLADGDPALLDHLETRGLLPGAELVVSEKAPFDGPLTVRLAGQTEAQLLGHRVARHVFVAPTSS